ncbi:retrovirus-related pol polyprotein from transposon TNT 1-94, partial [Tanacetum coccineum]
YKAPKSAIQPEVPRHLPTCKKLINHSDCAFSRFNTIITSLKALDESFSSRNHVRKFLRALLTKWRPKVTAIEESKDLLTLSLGELIGNIKVYEVVLEKDLEVSKNKKDKYKSLALKARQVLSEEDAARNMQWRQRKTRRKRKTEDVSSVVIQITSLVIVPNTPSVIKRRLLSGVGAIVEMTPRRKRYVRLKVNLEPDEWIKDSGYTKYMTGNIDLCSSYKAIDGETMRVEESVNVKFDESPSPKSPPLVDDDILENDVIENQDKDLEIKENEPLNKEITNIKHSKDHPLETVIGGLNERTLRSQVQNQSSFFCFVSTVEPKNVKEAIQDEIDKNGVVSRNKARLVTQGYNQQEGIYFDETYAPVARLESIRILLAYACAHNFKLYQMDVKSDFINGFIHEEVYVAQPPRFIDSEKPNHVFKLKKALYSLKQAPKAWYDRLKAFLIDHEYTMGLVDNTLFTKKETHISSSFKSMWTTSSSDQLIKSFAMISQKSCIMSLK